MNVSFQDRVYLSFFCRETVWCMAAEFKRPRSQNNESYHNLNPIQNSFLDLPSPSPFLWEMETPWESEETWPPKSRAEWRGDCCCLRGQMQKCKTGEPRRGRHHHAPLLRAPGGSQLPHPRRPGKSEEYSCKLKGKVGRATLPVFFHSTSIKQTSSAAAQEKQKVLLSKLGRPTFFSIEKEWKAVWNEVNKIWRCLTHIVLKYRLEHSVV